MSPYTYDCFIKYCDLRYPEQIQSVLRNGCKFLLKYDTKVFDRYIRVY